MWTQKMIKNGVDKTEARTGELWTNVELSIFIGTETKRLSSKSYTYCTVYLT